MTALNSITSKSYLLIIASITGLILVFFLLGPPQLLARSRAPDFCGGCHAMQSQYEAWFHAGAHRRKDCVDCHLPNENVVLHYLWKSLDGAKDLALFYSGAYSDPIKLSSHGAQVLQSNCIRCHSSTVEQVNPDRKCWDCHRRLMHTRSGAIATN